MNAKEICGRISFDINLTWSQDQIRHEDRFFVHRLNPWRDLYKGSFLDSALTSDGPSPIKIPPGEIVPPFDRHQVFFLPKSRLDPLTAFEDLEPGRFYPKGMVRGMPGIFKGNMTPFRCLDKDDQGIVADFNHPLARTDLTLSLGPRRLDPGGAERGGSCTDWMALALDGPGMQARGQGPAMALPPSQGFRRKDPSDDARFYRVDRFVHHIDDRAREHLAQWYQGLVPQGGKVLDLMAGWASHLPEGWARVHGLGLNANEMAANPCLADFSVQDLNQCPDLAFGENTFDAVICSLSVEYLTCPTAVFQSVRQVLRPGGIFAVSFSHRWFPEKVIDIWTRLHAFERLGLVLAYFDQAKGFSDLSTFSLRGHPRPVSDRYFPRLLQSDPLFGVAGRKTA